MPDLEEKIAEWRRQMLAAGIKTPVPLDELESHLREDVEQQMKSGLSEAEAFRSAVQRIGGDDALKAEFAKVDGTGANVLSGFKILVTAVFVGSVVALNVYLVGELQALCLVNLLLLSFVLPFAASIRTQKDAAGKKLRTRVVCAGQLVMGGCGLLIIFSSHPIFGLTAAIASCIAFAFALLQHTRAAVARARKGKYV